MFSKKRYGLLLVMLLALMPRLAAQHRDTVYVIETQVVYDTIISRDTLYLHDTLLLKNQPQVDRKDEQVATPRNDSETSTPLHNDKLEQAAEKPSASTPVEDEDSRRKVRKNDFLPDPILFKGFQMGYVLEADILSKAKLSNTRYMMAKNAIGGHIGLEFAYHFAKYLGISAGLSYGTTGALRLHYRNDTPEMLMENSNIVSFDNTYYGIYSTGFSMPVKFEFHAPISQKVWVTVDAGVRLRMPWHTFMTGYDDDVSSPYSLPGLIWPDTTEYYDHLRLAPEVLDANRFNADLLADAGFYFRLGHSGLLRWTFGVNFPFRDFATGNYSLSLEEYDSDHNILPPTYDNGTFRLRSNMFNTQITFIQTFQKSKKRAEERGKWKEEGLYRHEIKFDVCDPTGVMLFDRYFVFVYPNGMEPNHSWRNDKFYTTPVFSLSSHYRVAKWFWLGLSFSTAYYRTYNGGDLVGSCNREYYSIAFMPEVRFSYLNRPHVTLYSALSVGFAQFFGTEDCYNVTYPENRHPWFSDGINGDYAPTQFSTLHVTLLGVKAGWKHVFGSIELGAGYKGLGSIGIGYEF